MKSWDPFRDLLTIQDRMNKLFESVLTGPVPMEADGEGISYWRPVAQVVESTDTLDIECELAGLTREQVDLSVEGDLLVVQGERVRDVDATKWTFHQLERPFGKFMRKFELPEGLDLEAVSAELDAGVLRVTFPKLPEHRARPIELH